MRIVQPTDECISSFQTISAKNKQTNTHFAFSLANLKPHLDWFVFVFGFEKVYDSQNINTHLEKKVFEWISMNENNKNECLERRTRIGLWKLGGKKRNMF